MAILTALLAFVGRQLSTLVQAVLGWSVTALFGRLSSLKQTALSVALLLSILWPVAVVGVFVPAVSAWAFAFLPLQKWLGHGVVRVATLVLALAMPLAVGALTRFVAPIKARSAARTIIAGYPLTIGYAAACLVTIVTVPIVKLASVVRRWSDEHVFVQARAGEYEDAVGQIVRACGAAGLHPRVELVPERLRLASTVLKWLARGAVAPMVAEEPRVVRAEGVELYLYPADLLLRGVPATLARVRATMTRTWLERHAFTVADPKAQKVQEEVQKLWAVVRCGDDRLTLPTGASPCIDPRKMRAAAGRSLRRIATDLDRASIPFDEWVILDRSLHRLEQVIGGGGDVLQNDLAVRSARGAASGDHALAPDRAAAGDAAAAPYNDAARSSRSPSLQTSH